jgi:cell division ATPase FtsA
VFGTGVRVGLPSENIGGLIDSVEAPRFATAVGLAQYAGSRLALGGATSARRPALGKGMEGIGAKIKFWLQDFF